MRKASKNLYSITACLILLCCIITSCSKKESTLDTNLPETSVFDDGSDNADGYSVIDELYSNEAASIITENKKEKELELTYPENIDKTYFYEFANEITSDYFYPETDNRLCDPIRLEGSVVKIWEDVTDLVYSKYETSEYSTDIMDSLMKDVSAYTVETDMGPVIILDILPYNTAHVKKMYDKDLITLKRFKTAYSSLKNYSSHPELGEKAIIYGFYYFYSEKYECPILLYGLSRLNHDNEIPFDYKKYRTESVKDHKYKNIFNFKLPASWSDANENGDIHEYYNYGATISIDYYDITDGPSVIEMVDELKQYINTPEFPADLISDNMTTLSDGTTALFEIQYSFPSDTGDIFIFDALLFEHKNNLVQVQFQANSADANFDEYLKDFELYKQSIELRGY